MDDCSQALDQRKCVIFFDVRKVFDRVPHLPLLQLQEININPYLIRWLKDYLSNRFQFVAVDGEESSILPVVSGVPRGSVLGPLLVIMYINSVTAIISPDSEINMFADDITLYRIIKSLTDYSTLQEDVNSIFSFMDNKTYRLMRTSAVCCLSQEKDLIQYLLQLLQISGSLNH